MSASEIPPRCGPYEEDLSAWLDGQLDAAAVSVVRGHVETCERCTARVAELRAVDHRLREIAGAAPSVPEAERLARLRARLAAEQAQLQPLPERAIEPAAVAAAAPHARRAASRRRRWWPAALGAAAAAALTAALVLPSLLEDTLSTTEAELVAEQVVEARRDRAPAPAAPAPFEAPPAAQLAERSVARTPGHKGSSADPGSPESAAPAVAGAALADTAAAPVAPSDDDLALALALDAIEAADPADLAVVERLDALARMAEPPGGGGQ